MSVCMVCVCGMSLCVMSVCMVCVCVWYVCVYGVCVCVVCLCVWCVCVGCLCVLCLCVWCVCVWYVCVYGVCVCVEHVIEAWLCLPPTPGTCHCCSHLSGFSCLLPLAAWTAVCVLWNGSTKPLSLQQQQQLRWSVERDALQGPQALQPLGCHSLLLSATLPLFLL